jgi:hypothetical protein
VLSLFVTAEGRPHAAGFSLTEEGVKLVPCYWAGGARFDLPGGEAGAALAIFVSRRAVYTAGYHWTGSRYVPCYWIGTTRTDLPCGAGGGEASALFVSGSSVWLAGSDGGAPCFWQGSTETTLTGHGEVASIFVSEGTVYTAGQSDGQACFWVNTTKTALAVEASQSSAAYSILVRGGTVYTAGAYTTAGNDVLCTWANSARTDLTDPAQSIKVNSVVLR